jgi:hypothetical protein
MILDSGSFKLGSDGLMTRIQHRETSIQYHVAAATIQSDKSAIARNQQPACDEPLGLQLTAERLSRVEVRDVPTPEKANVNND